MRGTQGGVVVGCGAHGIIPAYAGNTPPPITASFENRDHPRVCGEHSFGVDATNVNKGSSPRMRGTHQPESGTPSRTGIIPAYAGNTLAAYARRTGYEDHPRVCGEHRLVYV